MRFFKRTVAPTLLLSEAGVLVEALEHHAFPPGGQKAAAGTQEVQPPAGAAAIAVQFVHELGVRFGELQTFRLSYFQRAPSQDLFEEYLAVPYNRLRFVAVPIGPETLTPDQRRVIATLLSQSDPKAWAASDPFRSDLDGSRR
jgi:hypothetical protein